MDVPLSTSTAIANRDDLLSPDEQLALAGFLAGYSGLTREAYTLDLRQYVAGCTEHRVAVFGARRAGIECFARHLEGGKVVTVPLAPWMARAIDLAVGERCTVPIFVATKGEGIDRHTAGRIVRRIARRAGIPKRVGPHTLRHAFITAALDAGVPLRDVQEAASHGYPAPPCATTAPGRHSTGTPPTSWQPSSPAPAADPPARSGAARSPQSEASLLSRAGSWAR